MRTPDHTTPRLLGGRYELDRVIAAGGMATVHLARQIGAAGFSRVVAIKKPHPHFATQPEFLAMFVDEAHLCARVQHPNVVQILDVVVEDGSVYVVMEYVHAESLCALCKYVAEGIPVPIACAIACAMLHGLHAAHEAKNELGEPLGIVHRDVSPHNVLVGADGVARVIDFGVAKAKERTQEQTDDGKLKGKFSYIAPEQIRGAPQDRRIDVYAVAVTLWELLARRPLFRRDNDAATLNAVLGFVVPPPSTYNPEVGAALDAVVLKGLARDPEARWASAASMAAALDSAIPLASANTIGAWVREHAPDSLRQRDARIQELEAEGSKSKRAAAASRKSVEIAEPTTEITKVEVVPRISEPLGTPQLSTTLPSIEPARGASSTTRWLVIGAVLAACAGGVAFSLRRSTERPTAEEPAPPVSAAPAVSAPLPPPRCPAEMQEIEGGQFFMGSDEHLPSERPAHPVTLTAYCIDRHQVTSAQYKQCSDRGDCKRAAHSNSWRGITSRERSIYDPVCTGDDPERAQHPINCIEWSDAARFCEQLGKRLPTEAEWELAARDKGGNYYPWGDEPPSAKRLNACGAECVAWGKAHGETLIAMYSEDDGFATTAPVGTYAAEGEIADLAGNVWEWTANFYASYTKDAERDPRGPKVGKERVIRGGAYNGSYPDWVRPSFRYSSPPETRSHGIGFRCAKSIDPPVRL